MNAPRLNISPFLAEHMAYAKFARRPVRVLILESHYWIDQACASAAERLGWQVAKAQVTMQGHMSRELLQGFFQTLVEVRPDFILSINLSGMDVDGMLARFFADLKVPHATWFVDDPRTILMGRSDFASDYAVALTWEAAYSDYLSKCGFAAVKTLPLALDESVFLIPSAAESSHPPAFVAHSMVDYAEREWEAVRARPALLAAVNQAFAEERVNRTFFAAGVEAVLGPHAASFDAEDLRRAELVFFIEGTRRLRRDLVQALAPEGLVVRGDEDWRAVTMNWGPGLGYNEELAPFYRDCRVNLNSTSIQMTSAVNQRVFDCPGAGGFLLTDNQASLAELFDVESEVAVYNTLEEAREQLRWFAGRPEARKEIVARARKRILGEHTYRHRLEEIAGLLKGIYGE
ncbi:MAG: glycosyltransferase [Candidatus Hydrogenedentes bacterium]|nr:glycosyltransferase [Candidatus Hydrogenedentota bacterium]